jgi:arylformamidase
MNIFRHIPDKQTLEKEYSPSSCVTSIREYVDAYAARSAAVRRQSPERIVIRYGASLAEAFDFFPAPATSLQQCVRPVLVYFHGGYWQELSKEHHSFPAAALNQHGISYAAVGYGLAPAASLDEMVDRCRRAVAWLVRHAPQLAIDPCSLHVAGSSAGAHLAAMAGLTDWGSLGLPRDPVRSLTLLSGVYDLRPLLLTYVNDALGMNQEHALRNSPLFLIKGSRRFPPALIVYGDNETAEFKRQSIEFFETLIRLGAQASCHEIQGRNHFDLPFDIGQPDSRLGALMLEHFAI